MDSEKKSCCCCGGEEPKIKLVKEAIESNRNVQGALIPVLHKIQSTFGYLPEDMLQLVSKELDIPMAEIYGVATFYSIFSLVPVGRHVIRVCLGTACYVKGSQLVMDELSKVLDIEVGKTTKDGKFTLQAARCLGACGLAPAMMIDEKVYGKVEPKEITKILEEYN